MIAPSTLVLALALVFAPALPDTPPTSVPPAAGADAAATRRLIIQCSAAEFADLRTELRARWPDAEVLPYGAAAFEQVQGRPFAYLEVVGEPVGDAPVAITLVLSDGRAYLRRVVPSDAGRARVLAVAIANLLGAVVDEDVPPDRVDVEVPKPVDVPEPVIEQTPTDPVAPIVTTGGTDSPPRGEPAPGPAARSRPLPRRPSDVPWRLGLRADVDLLVGLGPASRRGRPAFGGQLALDARAPRGLGFGLGVRVVGDSALAFRLVRTRLAPWLGYVGRAGRLEYMAGVGPIVEPWRLRSDGRGRTLASREGRSWTVLYGATLHAALGWWTPLPTRRSSSLRLGFAVDLAATSHANGKSIVVRDGPDGPELFSLGGVELAVGAQAAWWFDLRPRPAASTRRRSATQ